MAGPVAGAHELVFALCHEVGNLLAASRLHAHLLGDGEVGAEGPGASIATLAARGGSLLAQVRPLLAPDTQTAESLEPIDVLDALQREVGEPAAGSVRLDLRSALELPAVRVPSEVIHHLLLTAVFGALDELRSADAVRVSAGRRGDRVAFRVEYPAAGEVGDSGPLCGRRLERACADAILARLGGGVELEGGGDRTRVSYWVTVL